MFFTVAVQIFNVSIDPADDFKGAEDIAINEIESCVEFVLEVVLGRKNAIKESDETEESSDKSAHVSVVLFCPNTKHFISENPLLIKTKPRVHESTRIISPTLSVTSPPPKQA
jgi:hypothetical protein